MASKLGKNFQQLSCQCNLISIQRKYDTARLPLIATPTLIMAFTGIANSHGPSPQPTARRSLACNSNRKQQGQRQGFNLLGPRSMEWMGKQSGDKLSWSVISPVLPMTLPIAKLLECFLCKLNGIRTRVV